VVKNEERLEEKYSLALSLMRMLITFPNWVLISLKKDINIGKSSDVSLNKPKYIWSIHHKGSKISKDVTWLGPQILE